jgi:hypothetical protein
VNWTGHFAGTTNALCCVAWSGSQFVAVGASGTILTASNMLVPAAPVITTQPQSLTATVRSNIGISTIASGTPEPTYQWQKNGAAISGAIASTLTLTNVQMSDAGAYSVKASNSAGSVTSNVATLTVNAPISPPYFVTASSSQTVVIGRSAIFQVFAGGEPPFTYQWLKNGTAIAGATSATLGFGSVQASDAGAYSVILSNSGGSITSSPDILMVKTSPFAPGIAAQPASQAVTTGANVTFTVAASGSGTLSYQWQKDGTAITGATGASYSITTTLPADAGSYTCVVTNSAGSSTSAAGTLTVYPSRLANLSVRAPAGAGDQTLILGFYIGGTGSKQVLIRGVGPTLAQYGVSGVLADPQLKLFNVANVQINQNDNWGGGTALANAFTAVNDFALPANSKDAALLVTLPLDGYTAQVNSADTSTGVAMIEAYETDTGTPGARFTALSARNQVGMGDNILIAGFVVTGNAPKTLLIRGIGPTLANYGVSGVLADPQLALFDGTSTKIAGNDNWGGTTALSDAFTATQAFPLPATSKDAALLVTLQPGLYSAQISGVGGTTGVALVEVYEVP